MPSVVTQLKEEQGYLQGVGTVISCEADAVLVNTDQGVFTARQALSCLVVPEEGDRVLVVGMPREAVFIVAVLDRQGKQPLQISLQGDCSVKVLRGRLNLAAEEELHLLSSKELGLDAANISIRASRSNVIIDTLSFVGSQIFAQSQKIRLIGVFFDSVMERFAQRFKRSYRVVEEIDHVRSDEMDYRAENNLSLRGKNTLIEANDIVRLDGDQIHLG